MDIHQSLEDVLNQIRDPKTSLVRTKTSVNASQTTTREMRVNPDKTRPDIKDFGQQVVDWIERKVQWPLVCFSSQSKTQQQQQHQAPPPPTCPVYGFVLVSDDFSSPPLAFPALTLDHPAREPYLKIQNHFEYIQSESKQWWSKAKMLHRRISTSSEGMAQSLATTTVQLLLSCLGSLGSETCIPHKLEAFLADRESFHGLLRQQEQELFSSSIQDQLEPLHKQLQTLSCLGQHLKAADHAKWSPVHTRVQALMSRVQSQTPCPKVMSVMLEWTQILKLVYEFMLGHMRQAQREWKQSETEKHRRRNNSVQEIVREAQSQPTQAAAGAAGAGAGAGAQGPQLWDKTKHMLYLLLESGLEDQAEAKEAVQQLALMSADSILLEEESFAQISIELDIRKMRFQRDLDLYLEPAFQELVQSNQAIVSVLQVLHKPFGQDSAASGATAMIRAEAEMVSRQTRQRHAKLDSLIRQRQDMYSLGMDEVQTCMQRIRSAHRLLWHATNQLHASIDYELALVAQTHSQQIRSHVEQIHTLTQIISSLCPAETMHVRRLEKLWGDALQNMQKNLNRSVDHHAMLGQNRMIHVWTECMRFLDTHSVVAAHTRLGCKISSLQTTTS